MAEAGIRRVALARAVQLEVLTVAWMAAEAVLAIGAGIAARSVVLTAFGVDSVVELLSGIVLLWRLSVETSGADAARVDRVEKRTTLAAAILLSLVSAYVIVSSAGGLVLRIQPEGSVLGIAVAAAAVIAMPLLAAAKHRVNRKLGSAALRADIAETTTCAYMAGVTLAGVALSMLFSLGWVQYLAALVLLVWLLPETKEAWEAARD
jgi:divalent metal cation (Fe/Co/Zn/Cd) transporter